MKIVFFEASENEQKHLKKHIESTTELSGADVTFHTEKLTKSNTDSAKDAQIVSVFINSTVSKEIIDALPELKLLVTRSTGFDHIDCKYAKEKGIKVANMPAYGSRTVAEYTFALILGLSRKVLEASYQVKNGRGFDISNFRGFDLFGKTLGVVGTGKIGLNVAQIAKGFGMNVLAYDLFPNKEQSEKIGFSYVPLDKLLSESDVVTLHVPGGSGTKHLIDKENIKKFKPGAVLVNTARGEVCDTEAILWGIQEKILSAVGLDVLEGERSLKEESQFFVEQDSIDLDSNQIKTLLEDHLLIDRPEVFITPHIAFFTREAQHEIVLTAVENIVAFLKGEDKNIVKV
jgi:D-lactate dehydrogenase